MRWINGEPEAQREFGSALVDMMLEAGSNPRVKNKGGLTAYQLVDPRNAGLRELIQRHEYAILNRGDFVATAPAAVGNGNGNAGAGSLVADVAAGGEESEDDDDAEFSGSDDEERAEWERRRKEKAAKKG